MIERYFQKVTERLELVLKNERENIKKAAYAVSEAIQKGGIINYSNVSIHSNSYLAVAILLIVTSFIGLFRKRESGE
jgi:uncharacterized phosphosugar-binding protein